MRLPLARYVKAHHISHAALCVGAVVAALVFFVVGAGIRLLMGPVSLGPLAGTIAQAIQTALPGISLQYDQAAIEWNRDEDRVNLVVLGARMLDENGKVVATAPKADIDLAAAPFLRGKFAVRRITLVGVDLSLVHMKDGGLRLGKEGDAGNGDLVSRLKDVIDAKSSNTSSLKSLAVRDAHIALFDESTGLYMVAPKARLVLSAVKNAAIDASFESDVDLSGHVAHVKADFLLPPDTGPITGNAIIANLDLRGLGAHAELFKVVKDVALSVDLSIGFAVAPGAHLTSVDFDMNAHGKIPLAALKDKSLHVAHLHLAGRYDGVKNHIAVNDLSLDAVQAKLHLIGAGDLTYDAHGALDRVAATLGANHIALDMPGLFEKPVAFQSLKLNTNYTVAARTVDIGTAQLLAPGFALDVKGRIVLGEKGQSPGLMLSGRLGAMPVRPLLHYWPLPAASDARDWIAGNIFAGVLGPLLFETHFTPGMTDQAVLPEDSMHLTFAMSGVEGNYIKGLTHLTGVGGNATLTGDTFSADFTNGHVGTIAVTNGHGVIPNLHQHGTVGVFSAHADGAMGDVMTLIDMKPLGYPTRFGIDPSQTKGQASIDLSVKVPMLRDVPVDDVGISVKAAIGDFAVNLGKLHLTNGTVSFDIDNDRLHQTGTVQLADSKMAVDWVEDFKTTQPITTRLNVKGVMTEAVRAALNVGLTTILTGPVTINGDLQGHRGSLRTADVGLDLTAASIVIPIINLEKTRGDSVSGRMQIDFGANDEIADETIRLTGTTLMATGSASFDKDGKLKLLAFPAVKMGPLNDLSFTLAHTAAGDDYTLRGHSLDGSMIGRNGTNTAGGVNASVPPPRDDSPAGPFHINAKLDRFAMRDGVAIAPFNLDLSGIGMRPSGLALSGALTSPSTKSAPITADIDDSGAGRKLTVNASDAGTLIRGLFAFESLRSGKLALAVTLPGKAGDAPVGPATPDYQGTLTIADFTMVNQPFLTRLFSAGSLTGIGDLMGSDGISIEELQMPFNSKNNVISVHDAIARGRAIGATAEGYIDRPKNMLALKGSLVPAYGLNSVLGHIPLLGDVLVSKKGEGVFGVTYSATGNADQPKIDVNPLSVLTPGILRRIFEGHMPTAANAPSNAPLNAQSSAAPVTKPAAN